MAAIFPDDIIKCVFPIENVEIAIKFSRYFVSWGPIAISSSLVQIMLGAEYILVTRTQWVPIYSELHYLQHSSRQNRMDVHSTYVQTKGRQFKPFMVSVLFDGTGFENNRMADD